MIFSISTVAAAVLSLTACGVHGDNHTGMGKPEVLVGFEPMTDVRDQARIDMDQAAIITCLEGGTTPDYTCAQNMYVNGAHSKSVSTITISDMTGLPADILQLTRMMGVSANGTSVTVFAQGSNYTEGNMEIKVQYVDEGCYVGANIIPITEGCLAPTGNLTVDGGNVTFSYTYVPNSTANVYNIQGFTLASEFSFAEGLDFTSDFQKFVDFYGSESYADDIIMAALTGISTAFPTGKDMDMSAVDDMGRIEVISKATAYMAVWMYVIRELEHAIYLCETGDCAEESCLGKGAVHEVDESLAFYAGSIEGPEGNEDGVLAYRLAEKRALNFKTAGEDGDELEGTSKINLELIPLFTQALEHIVEADCDSLHDDTTKIVQKMTVPLIQGTMRYVYYADVKNDTTDRSASELAILVAAVLPFVAACNATAADLIYNHTKIGKTETDLPLVRAAFESQYKCMGITGADVGGLWDDFKGMYYPGMEPLGWVLDSHEGKPEVLVGFEPETDVRDQARIDMDQAAIITCLEGGTTPDYTCAQNMYENGAHSKSVSTITISDTTGLPADILQLTRMMGVSADGTSVTVFAQGSNYTEGDMEMKVQYVDEGCYVGANTIPITEGCLAPTGNLTVGNLTVDGGNVTFSYTYDPNSTANVYNIKLFTQPSEYRFAEGLNFTSDFQKFVNFYGSETYAGDIIMAALTGTSTFFPTGKDLDMSAVDDTGRIEVISKATAYMAVWMYVIRELEHAIYLCETGDCAEESCLGKGAVHEVDESLAFYAGSIEGPEGNEDGVLAYRLAEKRALNFKTAGEDGDELEGTSKINLELIPLFTQALEHIVEADCDSLHDDTTKIVQKMTVPLIQGTMRYVYYADVKNDTTDRSASELAILAAAVLPFVAACNATAADLIYNHTKIGKTETDLPLVRAAFESQYKCMGITGADVGGLWDDFKGMYYPGMEPLGWVLDSHEGKPEVLVGFEPETDVRDQARIDMDQAAIITCLEGGTTPDYTCAQNMYENGAHSKSVSTITISDIGLPADILQLTRMMGVSADGTSVTVFAQGSNYTEGDTEMKVQYVDEGCYVGANTIPITEGCLAPTGNLTVGNLTVDGGNVTFWYTYDPNSTANVYNIKLFTQPSEYRFAEGLNFTSDFQKFVNFYGSETYAGDIIMAALTGTSTFFPTGKDLDMSAVDDTGRIEVISKATAYMAVWMYIIRELEHAIYLCETGDCAEESCLGKGAVHEVDESLAFYAGSIEGPEGNEDGVLAYRLAEKRALNFKTAGEDGDELEGTSKINLDLIPLFTQALDNIVNAQCSDLHDDTTKIVQKMTVPLIQGTMRYVYYADVKNDTTDKSAGELAIFAAAVLPFVAACNYSAADLIYDHTKIGKNNTNLTMVRAAFESQYECMGITGADIGGYWDEANGKYFEGMEPLDWLEGDEDEPGEGGTNGPTLLPSNGPTNSPTLLSSNGPTNSPTLQPSNGPTAGPTNGPTSPPSNGPTTQRPTTPRPTTAVPTMIVLNNNNNNIDPEGGGEGEDEPGKGGGEGEDDEDAGGEDEGDGEDDEDSSGGSTSGVRSVRGPVAALLCMIALVIYTSA